MRRRASPDVVSLTAGLVLLVLGAVLLLGQAGSVRLTFASMAPIALGAVGAVLLADGLSRGRRER